MGMEVRRAKTHSTGDRQKPCSRCTSSDDSLQQFRRVQNACMDVCMHIPFYLYMKIWTRMHQCMSALPTWEL